MRYLMKGGYWKNSEDEILKAAIMKYGLNQWARIASLMSRKSVKQCKSRWYEWIDPSIKKTDWTREEEEKLLHLARLFPSQWRTIAPMLNRTPQMCIEHFEKLLDMTLGRTYDDDNDPRKLLPGEIDALAEHRPARADPIDMDDDEKEMIAEARVRIANRKGKKSKRKAREKVLEEARRLATIQKFRELRNAGVDFVIERKQKKKVVEFNYDQEVPLERTTIETEFKITEEEKRRANKSDINVANTSIAGLEGQRRDEIELKKRLSDLEKIKKLRAHNMPNFLERSRINDPSQIYGREQLDLEEPQLKDGEIEQLYRLNKRTASQFKRSSTKTEDVEKANRENDEKKLNPDFQCTDLLLADSSLNSFQNMVGRIRTPKAGISFAQQAKELIQINDPKASNDSSTVIDNKSVSMAPSIAKSKISTPNPLKQLIQDYNRHNEIRSRHREQSDDNYSSANISVNHNPKSAMNKESALAEGRSVSGSFAKLHDHLSVNQANLEDLDIFRNPINLTGALISTELNIEHQNNKLKKERAEYLKGIFATFPKPQNEFQIDFEDLMQTYKEAIGSNIKKDVGVEEIFFPKLSISYQTQIRQEISTNLSKNPKIVEQLNSEDRKSFLTICEKVGLDLESSKLVVNEKRSVDFDVLNIINSIVEEKCNVLIKSSDHDLVNSLAMEILAENKEKSMNLLTKK